MALKGTLKDFGIADILQLIGQQQKTGILHLKSREQEVRVTFREGSIVAAESMTRKKRDLIGTMLVRAEVISDQQLHAALEEQRRTLRRLGDVLVGAGAITDERFKEMAQLQATETLYRLFSWKTGTYEFEQSDVDPDIEGIGPLRAESVLMEGFRLVDEWPVIRKKISRYDLTFERIKELPGRPARSQPEDPDGGLDAAFDAMAGEAEDLTEIRGDFASLGPSERRVYALSIPGRDVRRIVDLACLGEFEACKALNNLVNLGYLKVLHPSGKRSEDLLDGSSSWERLQGAMGRVLLTLAFLGAAGYLAFRASLDSFSLSASAKGTVADPAAQRVISRSQVDRISAALTVYRLEKGEFPPSLDPLVADGLLTADDLRYPWRERYYYRRSTAQEFILLPPLR